MPTTDLVKGCTPHLAFDLCAVVSLHIGGFANAKTKWIRMESSLRDTGNMDQPNHMIFFKCLTKNDRWIPMFVAKRVSGRCRHLNSVIHEPNLNRKPFHIPTFSLQWLSTKRKKNQTFSIIYFSFNVSRRKPPDEAKCLYIREHKTHAAANINFNKYKL